QYAENNNDHPKSKSRIAFHVSPHLKCRMKAVTHPAPNHPANAQIGIQIAKSIAVMGRFQIISHASCSIAEWPRLLRHLRLPHRATRQGRMDRGRERSRISTRRPRHAVRRGEPCTLASTTYLRA